MTVRSLVALMIAGLLTWNSAVARPAVLGMVTKADRALLNNLKVTAGATVYDGDRFSTETGGMLRLQSGQAALQLSEASVISVRNRANGAQGMDVELSQGTLVFSTARPASLDVIALEASIRPVADTRTVAQITVQSQKELRIRVPRGALLFSYRGETETLSEGKVYRVILDPSNDSPLKDGPVHPPKGFKIVIGSEVAAVIALGIYELREPESPDRP